MGDSEATFSVYLLYGGDKAEFFTGPPNGFAIKLLLEDLLKLKIPHPKRDNIKFVSGNNGIRGCTFFWTQVPLDGVLHNQLESRVRPTRDLFEHQQLLSSLSIVSLTYKEQLVTSTDRYPRKLPSQAKAIPQYTNKQWIRQKEIPNTSESVPIKVDEAENLLNSMALEFQSNIRAPKIEPMDPPPSLFDTVASNREDSVASSRPSVPPDVAPQPFPSQGTQIVTESEQLPIPVTGRPEVLIPDSDHPSPMSISPPPSASLVSDTQPLSTSIPSERVNTPEFCPPGFVKIQPISPTVPRKRPLTPDSGVGSHSGTRPPPNPRDVSTIQSLTRELWDLRRQVTAGQARELSIINQLKALNSAFVPEPAVQVKSIDDSAYNKRLEAIENELRAERKKRKEAETALNDIERECREPFVVPALFEAFVSISKITSQAMDQDP